MRLKVLVTTHEPRLHQYIARMWNPYPKWYKGTVVFQLAGYKTAPDSWSIGSLDATVKDESMEAGPDKGRVELHFRGDWWVVLIECAKVTRSTMLEN